MIFDLVLAGLVLLGLATIAWLAFRDASADHTGRCRHCGEPSPQPECDDCYIWWRQW